MDMSRTPVLLATGSLTVESIGRSLQTLMIASIMPVAVLGLTNSGLLTQPPRNVSLKSALMLTFLANCVLGGRVSVGCSFVRSRVAPAIERVPQLRAAGAAEFWASGLPA